MGYTHYYEHYPCSQEAWDNIVSDCTKLFDNMPGHSDSAGGFYADQPLLLGHYSKLPEEEYQKVTSFSDCIEGTTIHFNGYPDGMSHESFMLERAGSGGFAFTKTANKPYDLMVCACLVVYHFHSEETMEIGSDGDWEGWEPALKFVEEVLGAEYPMKFKISGSDNNSLAVSI